MPFAGAWCKIWIYFGFVFAWTKGARPRFDTSTDMGLVLVPSDAEVDSVIFRLRATDQDADFPLVFEITATITPVVRIDNLPCTLYNKVCQANVILTKRLIPGRLHDFAVRVRDTKGDSNSMQATISVTNATTSRDKIFPHIPSLIMVPEDTKPGKELDYLLVRANSWSGKPVYIELWQPKELFTIRQRQTPTQTKGIITLIGELDFETQSVYTLTMYATDPYTEPGKDTRNIAGLNVAVVVTDVQDVPPIFTLAPPLTRINNSIQPGDIVLRVHAEDGDKGVPREIVYGLVSEGNPFTPFFNISEATGEITLARPLEELTQITHVGAPVVLTVVAEELRRSREEPPTQATVVDVGFLLGEPGNSPPYFESDNYVARIDENLETGTVINFGEYSTKVKDEDIGKAGVFALKLENNNGTFEISPTVAERTADFVIEVRDNTLIDYELYKTLSFKIIAQEVGPATNLSASVPVTIFLQDVNDNPPAFDEKSYEVTLSENVTAGSRVIQVHATDVDTGSYGEIRYTGITGEGSEAFTIEPDTGLITVSLGSSLDRETAERLLLSVEARDENGNGNKGVAPLIVNLIDVNDNAPTFEKDAYDFMLNSELTNFTSPAFIKAVDADAEAPNNVVKYELIHGNYENKFYLNETSGELTLRSPITKIRRKKQSAYDKFAKRGKEFVKNPGRIQDEATKIGEEAAINNENKIDSMDADRKILKRLRRATDDALYTLTARAYDLGIPHLSSVAKIRVISGIAMEARIMMFVVPGEQLNSTKTAETLATITGGRVTVLETRPYVQQNQTGNTSTVPAGGKKSIIVARVEQTEPGTPLVDVEKIRETLAANGVGIIGGGETLTTVSVTEKTPVTGTPRTNDGQTSIVNNSVINVHSEEVTVYKAENKLLLWLLIILGLLMLLAIAILIICCICPGCPFYMAPRKRRVHSSETLLARADGRPKRHLHRQPAMAVDGSWNGRKQAWSADPTRRNWQFNKRNVKNCSLPGDVAFISGQPNDVHMNAEAPRLRDTSYDHSRRSRIDEQERMYMEEMDGRKTRGYDHAEMDSLQRHEMDRDSDVQRQGYRQSSTTRYVEPDMTEGPAVREQHFYREGNAEVLRLVTRGQVEDAASHHYHHHPTTLIVDGKDIILQRFIEDQKSRHELSMQDMEAARVMDQRTKETLQQPPEIILIPDRLELGTRQHMEEIGPNMQRLVIDHGDYGSQKMEKDSQMRETLRQERQMDGVPVGGPELPSVITKDHAEANKAQFSFSELEIARQKALLARLLLRREHRQAEAGIADSASYLETQSLPGQVAIATQTDRTTATQTERQVRSRSDNDESDEDSRHRKKLKSRKKYGEGDWRRTRTLWMKSPIEEEASPRFDKRLNILRKKVKEVKEDRKISLEPEVLREISDSLDGNGSSYKGEEDESIQTYRKSTEQTSISYKILNEKENSSSCSTEMRRSKPEKDCSEKNCEDTSDYQKMNGTESTSSPEIKIKTEKQGKDRAEERSPKKEMKPKVQKKSDGVIKPSFRILEKEFTMLTKKFSKLGDKKFQESTGSDSASQEKLEPKESKDSKKDSDQKLSKKVDASGSQKQVSESTSSASKSEHKGKQKKEAAIAKTKQKLKYQQTQVMSTGSSEYDDVFDKTKKQGSRQESVKQKQAVSVPGHPKLKRQLPIERREVKKQMTDFREEEMEKRRDGSTKETLKTESKSEKTGKAARAPKLATIARRDNVTEETTSTNSDQAEGRKDAFALPSSGKKDSTDSSGKDSNGHRRDKYGRREMQKFSDDFVAEVKMESVGHRMVSEKGKQGDLEKVQVADEKKFSVNGKTQSKGNGLKNVKSSVEKPAVTERIQEKDSMGRVAEDKIFRNAAEEIIVSSVIADTVESKEKRESESSTIETKVMQDTKDFREEGELLLDTLVATKLSSKDEVALNKQKDATEDKREVKQDVEKESESSREKDESLEDAKKLMYEGKDAMKDAQKNEIVDEMQRQIQVEQFSKDVEEKDVSMKDVEKEIKQGVGQELKKQDIDLLSSSSKTDAEIKDSEIKHDKKVGDKLDVESTKLQKKDKTDIIQEIEPLVKETIKTEFLIGKKESQEEGIIDESKKFEKEELFQKEEHVEHSEPINENQTAQKGKEDTTKIPIADPKEVSVEEVKSPPKQKEIILETDDHQLERNNVLKKEGKSDAEEEKGMVKPEPQQSETKIEKEAAKVSEENLPLNKEADRRERKTSTEMKIDNDEIKGKENIFLGKGIFLEKQVSYEGEAIKGTEVLEQGDTSPDKKQKLPDITIEDNQIDVQEDIPSGTKKLSDEKERTIKEIKLDDHAISEKGTMAADKEKERTNTEKVEILDKKGEECHDKELSISETKDDFLITGQSDTSQQEIVDKISDVKKDNTSQEKNGSSSDTIGVDEDSIKVPASPEHDIKKDTPIEERTIEDQDGKKEGFLSEMFKAVHSFADKLTGSKGSVSSSSEAEPEAIKSSFPSTDKMIKTEVPSLSVDNKDKDHTEISDSAEHSDLSIDTQSLKQAEEEASTEDLKRAEEKNISENEEDPKVIEKHSQIPIITEPEVEKSRVEDKEDEIKEKRSITSEEGKVGIEWKEMIEKDLKIDVIVQPEDKDTSIQSLGKEMKRKPVTLPTKGTMTIGSEEMTRQDSKVDTISETKEYERSEEIPKEEETKASTESVDESKEHKSPDGKLAPARVPEEQRDFLQAKAEELVEKALEESARHAKATVDKLEQSSEREFHQPATEASDSSSRAESLETPATSETTEEKFPFDSIAPGIPADSREIAEPEERVESKNEETELPEAEQPAEKQTSAAEGEKMQSFSERATLQERDLPIPESSTADTIEKTDEAFTLGRKGRGEEGPSGEEYVDVSLPLFTNVISTVDDSDDSDSSSDVSRKTTLTTRPYQTPRHGARLSSERDSGQTMEGSDSRSVEDEEFVMELAKESDKEEDEEIKYLEDQQLKDSTTVEDSIKEMSGPPAGRGFESGPDLGPRLELGSRSGAEPGPGLGLGLGPGPGLGPRPGPGSESATAMKDKDTETKERAKTPQQEATVQSASTSKGQGSKQSLPKASSKAGSKSDKESSKDDSQSTSKRGDAESIKPSERRSKELEKRRIPSQRTKKSTSEESSEEKAHDYARYRPRRKISEDHPKQRGSQGKQSRKTESTKTDDSHRKPSTSRVKPERNKKASTSSEKHTVPLKTGEIDTSKAQPKYMAWYKKNREEMEKRRAELRATDDEEQLPKWLRRSMRSQKSDKEEKKSEQTATDTPKTRRKVKPLVNVESEQLKAIVRQGRKLRRAEGGRNEDPPVQIFATSPPAQPATDTKHHLVQHSEYKYEKIPAPFYLHPPPAPHPSPQMSPERFEVPPAMEPSQEEDFDSGIAISLQGGNRLRHQQLLEKKSVFDIAYSEAAPPQLRSDSTTPPS